MECPNSDYRYNPFSNTCLRYVAESKDYTFAKAACEFDGEKLATFETMDSNFWLNNLRKTDQGIQIQMLAVNTQRVF